MGPSPRGARSTSVSKETPRRDPPQRARRRYAVAVALGTSDRGATTGTAALLARGCPVVRLLSRTELRNTLQDVLGVTSIGQFAMAHSVRARGISKGFVKWLLRGTAKEISSDPPANVSWLWRMVGAVSRGVTLDRVKLRPSHAD